MSATTHPTKPLDARELASRWQAMCADPAFDDVIGKVELDEWGDVLMNPPVGKIHGLLAVDLGVWLRASLGGRAMVETGVITAIGIRAPDLAWCSDGWLAAHPEDAPLTSAPELCIEIATPSNSRTELRRKARAYIDAGATEAWIVSPADRTVEVHAAAGQTESTNFPLNLREVFQN